MIKRPLTGALSAGIRRLPGVLAPFQKLGGQGETEGYGGRGMAVSGRDLLRSELRRHKVPWDNIRRNTQPHPRRQEACVWKQEAPGGPVLPWGGTGDGRRDGQSGHLVGPAFQQFH